MDRRALPELHGDAANTLLELRPGPRAHRAFGVERFDAADDARADEGQVRLVVAVVALVGFCTYGPHILMVGHAAQDFGKKAGAGGAAGFIDAMGYVGATLTGVGAGALIDSQGLDPVSRQHGYEITFVTFGFAAILGALLTCLIWKVGPRTDEDEPPT